MLIVDSEDVPIIIGKIPMLVSLDQYKFDYVNRNLQDIAVIVGKIPMLVSLDRNKFN